MGLIWLGFAENSIQLVPDGTLILHVGVIVLMVMVLNWSLFKPINRILEDRYLRTQGLLDEARKTIAAVEERLTQYELALRRARADGYRVLEVRKGEAVRERERQLTAANEQLGKLATGEKQKIGEEMEAARGALASEARRMGLEISSRILGRPVNG